MGSVVLELQRDALNRSVPVSDLLRKALVVARKLDLSEFQQWIEKELSGYNDTDEIPHYREVSGQIRAWNPYRGWIPVIIEDPGAAERLSRRKNSQSIAEIENLLEGTSKNSTFHMPFSHELQRELNAGMPFETEITLFTQSSSLIRVIDAVRTIILNWSLKLEESDIRGEGLSFTAEEKKEAATQSYNVTNFYGPVTGPQVQQGSKESIQISGTFQFDTDVVTNVLNQIRHTLDDVDLPPDVRAEAQSEIDTVHAQLRSPKPKPSIIREGLQSLRSILEGAGGGAAAHLLIELGKLLI